MISDKYRLDTHKLDLHPARVADWRNGLDVYPIYLELSPSGACQHRCLFCSFDFMKYQNRFLDTRMLKERISEFAELGVKSIQFAGEGEPLLHPDIAEIIRHTSNAGIDVGISTNGVLLSERMNLQILPHCTWIKVSFNAGTPETYALVNGTSSDDFEEVINNLISLVNIRKQKKFSCTLGIQMVVLPENENEISGLAMIAKNTGLDYIVFKPYSHNPHTKSNRYKNLKLAPNWNDVRSLQSDSFKIDIREQTFDKVNEVKRPFKQCLALPFWGYIDAGGGVWGCYRHLNDDRFCYGNICQNTFEEIWNGKKRKKSLKMMEKFDILGCGINCRMDSINRYLWRLRYPERHDNFI